MSVVHISKPEMKNENLSSLNTEYSAHLVPVIGS